MDKKIRSISISEVMDSKLIDDSKSRGLTISANISRILFDYFNKEVKSSNKILREMSRTYSIEWYKQRIEMLRDEIPDIALSTDIIIGFGSESEKDFQETMDLINLIEFDTVYSFKYSVRPGTPGEKMKYHVPDHKASKRLSILQERQKEITFKKNCDNLGKIIEVLIEGYSKQNRNDLYGRTTYNKVVNVKNINDSNIGKLINVKITEATQNSLIGEQV